MDIETLRQLDRRLNNALELPDLFEIVLQTMPQWGADFGTILLLEENGTVHFRSTITGQETLSGPSGRRFAERLIEEGLEGLVMHQRKAEIVTDLANDPRAYQANHFINACSSAVVLPIVMSKAQAKGVLLFGSRRVAAFSDNDLAIFDLVTWLVSQRVESTYLYMTQAEHAAQLALINEVSRAATSILNVGVMLATVTQAIQSSFELHRVSIYRYMAPDKTMRLEAYTGADGRTLRPERIIRLGQGPITSAITQKQTIVLNDIKRNDVVQDEAYSAALNSEGDATVKSKLIIPITMGVKTIAILALESNNLDAFNPRLVSALEILTDQLAVAIENARLYDELGNKVNRLISLNHIGQAVSSSLNLHKTLTMITEHVTKTLDVAATSVALRDDNTNEIWFAAASGAGSVQILGLRIPLGVGIAGWVAKQGEPIIVPDVSTDPRFLSEVDKQSGFKTKSILCVPLANKGRLIGAIETMNKKDGGQFTIQDLNLLSELTAPAATAIEHARLYQDLDQKITQLEETQAQLIQSAKLSAIGELAAGVAHEINNPLTSIISLSSVVADAFATVNSDEAEDLRIIEQEAQRARKIVQALLDFSRVGKPIQTKTDINQIVQDAIFLALPKPIRYKVSLKEYLAPLPPVSVDANQIKQVLINMLNNAVQAMPEGGQITVTTQLLATDDDLTIPDDTTLPRPKAIALSIADTGGGINPDYEDKIFDPFFTTKAEGEGTGLGLSVSYGIIERHNGKIKVKNEPGVGVTFEIILPVPN